MPKINFLALFQEAFSHRLPNIVRTLVAAWRLPNFPVGALMTFGNPELYFVVVGGLRDLLTEHDCPVRNKMKVLDFRKVHHEFWTIWTGTEDGDCSSESGDEEQVVKVLPRYAVRRHLKVIAELCLRRGLDEEEAYFLQWAQERKGSLQLCCAKMKIWDMPLGKIKEILSVFQPWHIEELELNTGWDRYSLAWFATYLGHMRNLRKLSLAHIYQNSTGTGNMNCIRKFLSQVSKLHFLQHLSMKAIYFLRHQVNKLLRVPLAKPRVMAGVVSGGGGSLDPLFSLTRVSLANLKPNAESRKWERCPRDQRRALMPNYMDAKNRGYPAGAAKFPEVRIELAMKYGYVLPNITKDELYRMLSVRKDPRQIFFGLAPGWVVNMADKRILKPTDKNLLKYYSS
ncbi:Putative PRAME family member 25 [Cricetulus griseus]|uniref:Putative PRAME family member 25 n=1 Tax=Cricetulus griseus TaxID=10029 RepID=G3ICV3_CRIGR|nr:Putative PRAME family member 25 [Cricetulus griseus]